MESWPWSSLVNGVSCTPIYLGSLGSQRLAGWSHPAGPHMERPLHPVSTGLVCPRK